MCVCAVVWMSLVPPPFFFFISTTLCEFWLAQLFLYISSSPASFVSNCSPPSSSNHSSHRPPILLLACPSVLLHTVSICIWSWRSYQLMHNKTNTLLLLSVDVIRGQNESGEFSVGKRALLFGNMEIHEHRNGAVIMDGRQVSPNTVAFNKRNVAPFRPFPLSTPIQSFLSDRQLL